MLVTNETLAPLYLDKVRGVLNRRVLTSIALSSLTASSIKPGCTRYRLYGVVTKAAWSRSTLVALGGGVVGDLTGFAAAVISAVFVSFKSRRRYCRRSILRWRQNCGQPSPR